MVMRYFCMLVALTLPLNGFAVESSMGLNLVTEHAQYGKAVTVELWAYKDLPDLKTLDLLPLDTDFVVETPDNVVRDALVQTWRIRLHPRRWGELLIPSLALAQHKSEPIKIRVAPAAHAAHTEQAEHTKDSPIKVTARVDNTRVWVNQAVRVTMQLETDSYYDQLQTTAVKMQGVDIAVLAHSRERQASDTGQGARHSIAWLVYPQTPGELSIQLPAIDYKRNGVVSHRFYPPKVQLEVQALPVFVPPTMPVGRVRLDVSLPDVLFLTKHELAFVNLHLGSESPLGQQASALLRQLKSNDSVTVYAHREISPESDEPVIPNEYRYQVPFAPNIMGLINLPSVRLQYFDTSSGKITTRTVALGRFVAISPWLLYLLMAAMLLLVYKLLKLLIRRVNLSYRVYRAYVNALTALRQAQTPQAFKAALMEIARGEGWSVNLSLAMWLDHWLRRYPRHASLAESVLGLQRLSYAKHDESLEQIRSQLMAACYQRMPLLKILPL